VLDPFAGVGGIHTVGHYLEEVDTWGVEIEPEWAAAHPRTYVGDALNLQFEDETFNVIMTSPAYGNRMADHFEAKDTSRRLTYRHQLGRPLNDNNGGKLQWGDHYREFHRAAWIEANRVLGVGGLFVVNVSDHIRAGKRIPVTAWHKETLTEIGLVFIREEQVETRRMRFGANHAARVEHESILIFRKPLSR
jgi:tRNA G10  N-methylase Trm11